MPMRKQPCNTGMVCGVSATHCDQKGMHKFKILSNVHTFHIKKCFEKAECKILQINTIQINKWKWCFVFVTEINQIN